MFSVPTLVDREPAARSRESGHISCARPSTSRSSTRSIRGWTSTTPVDTGAGGQAVGPAAGDAGRARPRGARARPRAGPAGHGLRRQRRVHRRRRRLRRPVQAPAAHRRGRRPPRVLRGDRAGGSSRRARSTRARATSRTCPGRTAGSSWPATASGPSSPAHAEAQEALGRPVISLRLVDPRFYHLDMALAVARRRHDRLLPGRLLRGRQRVLAQLFPDAVHRRRGGRAGLRAQPGQRRPPRGAATARRRALAGKLEAAGYQPVPVELAELKKGGGSVKCCVAELRP